ncbi:hypothetical protein FGB62_285g03 [Gracilaria domingensis]|nr:hypothetical protein FGB62_285g03 [Gracilaria domingensis]
MIWKSGVSIKSGWSAKRAGPNVGGNGAENVAGTGGWAEGKGKASSTNSSSEGKGSSEMGSAAGIVEGDD